MVSCLLLLRAGDRRYPSRAVKPHRQDRLDDAVASLTCLPEVASQLALSGLVPLLFSLVSAVLLTMDMVLGLMYAIVGPRMTAPDGDGPSAFG
jgi:hypothetical protein